MDNFKFSVLALLVAGLIGAVLYVGLNRDGRPGGGTGEDLTLVCPLHNVPIGPSHPGRCTYQHGSLVFENDLHEGDVTITVETGHEPGRFCDHTQKEIIASLHHAEVDILKEIAVGEAHFVVTTDEDEIYRGHVNLLARQQVRCGITRGPRGELTCHITVEKHDEEERH